MPDSDIRRLDMPLLLVFTSLMRTRQTTASASELGMTQSSVSHALRRLRDIVGEPLFTRLPHGLSPTPRAYTLLPAVENIIQLARRALQQPALDLARATDVIRIGALDSHCAILAGPLIEQLQTKTPPLQVSFRAEWPAAL